MQAFIATQDLRCGNAVSRDVAFNCMFCSKEVESESQYRQHLDTAHPGWAELLVARLALNVPRING